MYNVSSPYVYDSCGDTLEKITVDLFDTRDGYTVVYKMDKEWLSANDRVYPVVFDPAIYTDEFQPSMIDTTYIQGEAPDYSSSYAIHFGAENYYFSSIEYRYSKYHGYIKFTSLPEIMNSGIISAKLNYTVLKNSQLIESRKPTLFKLAEPWRATNESSTAPYLYRSEPQRLYGEGNEVIGENINGQLSFDITQWFSSIYSGEYTYGFMLGYNEDRPGVNLNSTTINDVISIASCDNSVTANRPSLVVNYRINSPIITIKNKASGKFLNVSRINVSSNEMKGNVDQWTEDDTIGEAFRLETDPLTGYCRLYAFYNNYGLGYVVSRSSSSDNIITDDYSDNLSNWKIVDAGNGYYYFKSATDDNKYMTAHDSNNGSYSGTSNTSAGNVFLSSNKDDYAKWSINIVGDDNLITPMDVPLHLQETNITCSSACIRMLTHYYGKNYSESEITAMQKDENDSKWEYVYVVKNVINSATNDDLINYSFVDVSERISFNYKVYKSLANGRPVIINVTPKLPSYTCYSTTSDSGHYIVICGIVMQNNELCYIIKDPHYRYGDTYILSVENTYNSLTHHYIIGQWN